MTALAVVQNPLAAEADRRLTRIRWRADPVAFAEQALGYVLWPEQKVLLRQMQQAPPHWFLEAPPGASKTFILRIDRLHYICEHPLERGIWASATIPNVRDSVRWLREQLGSNETIREVYGVMPGEPWTDTAFQLRRPPGLAIKEPTVRGAGRGGTMEGWRADWIAPDDIIDQDAMYSEAEREAAARWSDSTMLRRLEPGGHIRGTANAWAVDDIYETWAKDRGFTRLQRPAMTPAGELLWPSRFTAEVCTQIKATDPFTWELRYMLNREAQVGGWRWPWIEQYMDAAPADLTYTIGVDPALSPAGDYFALAVIGTEKTGLMWLVDLLLAKGMPGPEQVATIIAYWKKWNASWIGIEAAGYQGALQQHVQAVAPACPCFAVPVPSGTKEVKLQSLGPFFESGRLRIARGLDFLPAFRQQYLAFPKGRHEDVLDAMWYAVRGASTGDSGFYDPGMDWRK